MDEFQHVVKLQRDILATTDPHELLYHDILGSGSNGVVFRTTVPTTVRDRFPPDACFDNMVFAAKFVYNFGVTSSAVLSAYEQEFHLLSRLPAHPNVNVYVAKFTTEPPDVVFDSLKPDMRELATFFRGGERLRRKSLLVLLRYHPQTLEQYICEECPRPMPLPLFLCLAVDLLQAYDVLEEHHVVHLDAKPNNVLVDFCEPASSMDAGAVLACRPRAIVADFGTARETAPDGTLET